MNSKFVESAILGLMVLIGVVCMLDTPEPLISFQKDYLGNGGYPRIVCPLLIAACLAYGAYSLFGKKGTAEKNSGTSRFILLPLLLACLYIIGISSLGFVISTALFLFCFSLLGQGKPDPKQVRGSLVFAVAVSAFTYGAFRLFKVYLPDALLF